MKNDYLCTRESEIGEYDNKQAIQHLQGVTRFRVPAGVLHGARGTADVRAGRDAGGGGRAGTVGSIHGARMLQIRNA